MARYKVGDKVWIREDLVNGKTYNGYGYHVHRGEEDIRGKFLEITKSDYGFDKAYSFKNYHNLGEDAIDHEKTASGIGYWSENEGITPDSPNYEVY